MRYATEPAREVWTPARIGILLLNLGTPEAPTRQSVRRYLKEFLSDPRVVEIPRIVWWPILNGIILNTRPAKSARKYASIWTHQGSPLRVHTERQADLLRQSLSHHLPSLHNVRWAMRYGSPSVREAMEKLKAEGCDRVLVIPLYPQYAASTTASAFDAVMQVARTTRNVPALRFVRQFHDAPEYIEALSDSVRRHWDKDGRADCLLMSFHGLPSYTRDKGDPYYAQCVETANLLAKALGLETHRWQFAFQSRFGRTRWLEPYTSDALVQLARGGKRSVEVLCPGFVSDCLETLEEIGIEGKSLFLSSGGTSFTLIPCLNESGPWIRALSTLVLSNLRGWADVLPSSNSVG